MFGSNNEKTLRLPPASASANGMDSSVYIGHLICSGRNFRPVVDDSEGDERVRRALSDRRHQVRAVEIPDAAADDRSLVLVQGPRESGSRPEIVPVRLIRPQRVPQRTEVHFAQIGGRFEIDDLHGDVRRRSDLDLPVVVVAQAEIQHEAVAQAPIVLEEPAVLIHVRVVRRRAKRRAQRLRDVREQIGIGLIRERRVLRVQASPGFSHEAEPRLHEMPLEAPS